MYLFLLFTYTSRQAGSAQTHTNAHNHKQQLCPVFLVAQVKFSIYFSSTAVIKLRLPLPFANVFAIVVLVAAARRLL